MAAYVQNCLDQDVKSSALNQAKEVLNSYLKETLKYCKAEGTIDHNNPQGWEPILIKTMFDSDSDTACFFYVR